MPENIARAVNTALDERRETALCEAASLLTERLLNDPRFDGARFRDLYDNVMAWLLRQDRIAAKGE